MTNAKPTNAWVTRLLAVCTPTEQHAISNYRCHVGKCHTRHTKGQLTRAQVTRIWTNELTKLADEACGSPAFDQYLSRQLHHLDEWATDEATQGRSG